MIKWLSDSEATSDWLNFTRTEGRSDKRKTERWLVTSRTRGVELGQIKWYGPWRQYVFAPFHVAPLFNQKCLDDISLVLLQLTQQHRQRNRRAKGKV